jgi:hypothetical protein
MINIQTPPQLIGSDKEQLKQLYTYMFQLSEQLNWALKNVDTTNNAVVATPVPKSLYSTEVESSKQIDAQSTFSSIKSLIIKSADIVEAYTEEINKRFLKYYKAESDFGTFIEAAKADIEVNAENITTAFTNIQTVETGILVDMDSLADAVDGHTAVIKDIKDGTDKSIGEVKGEVSKLSGEIGNVKTNFDEKAKALDEAIKVLNEVVTTVTGTIKSGEIDKDENGLPIYGVEVGQKNVINGVETFNKYARFTAGRLSFYDQNGVEVAYISDYKLHITHAEVTGTLKPGGYLVDTTNGIAFKWVGRG